jgi:Fe-S-cluster containining protein
MLPPLPSHLTQKAPVHDESQRFSCENCPAKCCKLPTPVLISQAEFNQYQESAWVVEHLLKKQVNFQPADTGYHLPRVPLASGGMGCVFLSPDDQCLLQSEEGHSFMPYRCQTYPFQFIQSGEAEESSVYLHYYCPSIQQNTGDPISPKINHRYRQAVQGNQILSLPPHLYLDSDARIELKSETYSYLSSQWSGFLENASTIQEGLWQGWIYLNLKNERIEKKHPRPDPLSLSLDNFKESLSQFHNYYSNRNTLPQNTVTKGSFLGRMVTSLMIYDIFLGFMEDQLLVSHPGGNRPEANLKEQLTKPSLQLLLTLLTEKGSIPLYGTYSDFAPKTSISLEKASSIQINESSPWFQEALKRYYQQLFLSQKIFESTQDLIQAHFRVVSTYPLILRFAKYYASVENRSEINLKDVQLALGMVDLIPGSFSQSPSSAQTWPLMKIFQENIIHYLSRNQDWAAKVLWAESI